MKKNEKILLDVFSELTKDQPEFIDWYDYKTAEVNFADMSQKIGVGIKISSDTTSMKLFYINENYPACSTKRFSQTFKITGSNPEVGIRMWNVELAQLSLHANYDNFSFISYHMQIAHMIMQRIEAKIK